MLEGETFMVLDAGGGTVDITVHKVGTGESRLPACRCSRVAVEENAKRGSAR